MIEIKLWQICSMWAYNPKLIMQDLCLFFLLHPFHGSGQTPNSDFRIVVYHTVNVQLSLTHNNWGPIHGGPATENQVQRMEVRWLDIRSFFLSIRPLISSKLRSNMYFLASRIFLCIFKVWNQISKFWVKIVYVIFWRIITLPLSKFMFFLMFG